MKNILKHAASLCNKKTSEISREDIQKIFDEIIKEKKNYVTANSILKHLSPIFNKAIDWRLLDKNPVYNKKAQARIKI
ncbi:integrase [Orientia tsutsugamushi]|uniref:Integrase n=1 Tax=Orientia tsutsugamushi TaxID=784 RepID=A0A2U3QSU5_ORITS|nr:hypothetical protein [Orientia tsutsugamushi]KJV90664.1 putative integrase [Orientia tsutsugamushi str. UT76]SPR04030.1 integrase [Orientia tsutsugamushi]